MLGTTYTNYNTGNEEENPVTKLYSENGYNNLNATDGYSGGITSIGLNKNSYNGQDYKSTSYQKGLYNYDSNKDIDDNYSEVTTFSYNDQQQLVFNNFENIDWYNFSAADGTLYSDAKDKQNIKNMPTIQNIQNI